MYLAAARGGRAFASPGERWYGDSQRIPQVHARTMRSWSRALDEAIKRGFDLAASGSALAALAVPLLALGIAVKLDSPGPVLYRGERIGQRGRPFRLFKLRSMAVGDGTGPSTTTDHDPRITRVGAALRRYKLDELPQLINVLLGDMSVVGPRPQVRWAVERFSAEEREILNVRPGITDWASIRFHNEGEIIAASGDPDPDRAYLRLIHPEKTRLQLEYVRRRSFLLDLRIIADTLSTLVRTRASSPPATGAVEVRGTPETHAEVRA
jgi:lipopolysaccharide/colanic/teichoic acid biosynthesis glycosyltransferase